jgi:hypothetical protein
LGVGQLRKKPEQVISMANFAKSNRGIDIRAEVMASPAYHERIDLLFELFQVSRQSEKTPEALLAIQAGLAEILKSWQEKKREFKNLDFVHFW